MISPESLARIHYENFPVGSLFIPRKYRRSIHLVYAFARVADDIADEGNVDEATRLQELDSWQKSLQEAVEGRENNSFFRDLAEVIIRYGIPVSLFDDLVTAFRMDARALHYQTFEDLLFYCRHSANPIGRILLHLFGSVTDENCLFSDQICTALQLTNFWQDISVDTQRNRVYIPQEDFIRFRYSAGDLKAGTADERFLALMKFEVDRTRKLFERGKGLWISINKDFRFELRVIWHGGMRVLERIERGDYNTLHRRPALTIVDKALVLRRAVFAD